MYLMSIPNRKPHVDDAWLGEHSYWLWHDGVVKSKLMSGIAGSEDRLLLHHKLFTLQGSAVISVFGFRLPWLKAVSLLYLVLSILVLKQIVKRMKLFNHPLSLPLFFLLLLLNPLVFEFSYVFRPEIMLMFLGLLSFFFVWLATKAEERPKLNSFISGLFAGLALVTHLNGIIFIASGFLLLALKRKFIPAVLFGIGATITSLGYFYDFRSISDFSLWYRQLTFIPSADGDIHLIIRLFYNSLGEHFRYFHSPVEISLSLLLLVTAFFGWTKLKEERSVLLVYTFLLMLTMSAFALNKTSKYLILLLPYFLMIVTVYIDKLLSLYDLRALRRIGMVASVYIVVSLIYNTITIQDKYDPVLNEHIRTTFAGEKSSEMHVLAPMEFIFDEIDNFEKITSLMSYNERLKLIPDLKATKFLKTARSEGIDLILLNDDYINTFEMRHFTKDSHVAGFVLVYKAEDLMVWENSGRLNPALTQIRQTTQYESGLFQYHSGLN